MSRWLALAAALSFLATGCRLAAERPAEDGGVVADAATLIDSSVDAAICTDCLPKRVRTISPGRHFNCVVADTGVVWCFGNNVEGQLGDSTTTPRVEPAPVSTLSDAISVVTSGDGGDRVSQARASCALRANGRVSCWGRNELGQLANNSVEGSSMPIDFGLANVADVSLGGDFICALVGEGEVHCAGSNLDRQLADGLIDMRSSTAPVPGVPESVALELGDSHACAISAAGPSYCWGLNSEGQLGQGSPSTSGAPAPVVGLGDAIAISAGSQHSCALIEGGAVHCWGQGTFGQLGDGNMSNSSVPLQVTGLPEAVAIDASHTHTCAITTAGDVYCWGANSNGELGTGDLIESAIPLQTLNVSNAVEIKTGAHNTCVRTSNDNVYCWGQNVDGELGDLQTNNNRPTPFEVTTLPTLLELP